LPKPCIFVSDLHLGAPACHSQPNQVEYFRAFLAGLKDKADHLFIVGDLFDFWMEYRDYIPKIHFGVLASLLELKQAGVRIHYFSGNHDFNLGTFFDQQLGIKTYNGPEMVHLQGRNIWIYHGDGMSRSDWKYRYAKPILRSPLANWLFKLIHPDLGMRLARLVSAFSRRRMKVGCADDYAAIAVDFLHKNGADAVLHGHTHKAFVTQLPEGTYINTGEWIKNNYYVVLKGGQFFLRKYEHLSPIEL
jgi:UDP-2,3-diacylglucosamine hydrolase